MGLLLIASHGLHEFALLTRSPHPTVSEIKDESPCFGAGTAELHENVAAAHSQHAYVPSCVDFAFPLNEGAWSVGVTFPFNEGAWRRGVDLNMETGFASCKGLLASQVLDPLDSCLSGVLGCTASECAVREGGFCSDRMRSARNVEGNSVGPQLASPPTGNDKRRELDLCMLTNIVEDELPRAVSCFVSTASASSSTPPSPTLLSARPSCFASDISKLTDGRGETTGELGVESGLRRGLIARCSGTI